MDRVGGMEGYRVLCEDARAYDDVLIAMAGEAEAAKIRAMQARAKGSH